jgi:predicted HTH domain antitoxin
MTTLTLQLELPDNFVMSEHEAKMMFAAKLYDERKLTAGKAAAMVGISKRDFLWEVPQYGIHYYAGVTTEDLDREFELACGFGQCQEKTPVQESEQG